MDNLKEQLIKNLHIEELTAKFLIEIGFTSIEECEDFLYPERTSLADYNLYKGFNDVKTRIEQAIKNNEKVVVYGDYDCDGVCASAMLYLFLKQKGVDVNYYIPNRHEHGYGMNIESLEEICEEYFPDLLITVDCGITSVEEVNYIHEALGFDVIITDHHKPQETLPDCPIFNPHLSSGVFSDLCGAGVVLRLIESIDGYERSLSYYDIATIATIADLVPLVKDNRKIAKIGLNLINQGRRPGLKKLIESAGLQQVSSQDVAFRIAPRINAAGRLSSAGKVVSLFYEDDPFLITTLVEELNELNKTRQELTNKITRTAEELLTDYDFENNPIIVLKNEKWEEGVIGIVAAKLVSEYKRPVIMFTESDGKYKGSGRSIPQIDLFDCVSNAKEHLLKFGGHKQACGLAVSKDNFEIFKQEINNYAKAKYLGEISKKERIKAFDFHEIKDLVKQTKEIEMLQPFGEKNPTPLFVSRIKNLGFRKLKVVSEHITYKSGNFQIMAFYMAKHLGLLNSDIDKDIYFDLSFNFFNNKMYVNATLQNFECVDASDHMQVNYLESALYDDKSIFKPKVVDFQTAINMAKKSPYYTALICYDTNTYKEARAKLDNINENLYCVLNKSPITSLYYAPRVDEVLNKYKKVIFLNRPIALGVIDDMILNKDCEVYYVENLNALNSLKKYLLSYEDLGKIYMQIISDISFKPGIDLDSLYMDIEKTLNVNYNSFVVALYIFLELGVIEKDGNSYKINRQVKNPIINSMLYKKLLGAES